MKGIDSQTRRKMVQFFAMLFLMIAYPIWLGIASRCYVWFYVSILVVLPSLFSLLPLLQVKLQQRASRQLHEGAQRLAEYKASPESHLLHLND